MDHMDQPENDKGANLISRSLRLKESQWDAVDRWARERRTTRSQVIREALAKLLGKGWIGAAPLIMSLLSLLSLLGACAKSQMGTPVEIEMVEIESADAGVIDGADAKCTKYSVCDPETAVDVFVTEAHARVARDAADGIVMSTGIDLYVHAYTWDADDTPYGFIDLEIDKPDPGESYARDAIMRSLICMGVIGRCCHEPWAAIDIEISMIAVSCEYSDDSI